MTVKCGIYDYFAFPKVKAIEGAKLRVESRKCRVKSAECRVDSLGKVGSCVFCATNAYRSAFCPSCEALPFALFTLHSAFCVLHSRFARRSAFCTCATGVRTVIPSEKN